MSIIRAYSAASYGKLGQITSELKGRFYDSLGVLAQRLKASIDLNNDGLCEAIGVFEPVDNRGRYLRSIPQERLCGYANSILEESAKRGIGTGEANFLNTLYGILTLEDEKVLRLMLRGLQKAGAISEDLLSGFQKASLGQSFGLTRGQLDIFFTLDVERKWISNFCKSSRAPHRPAFRAFP